MISASNTLLFKPETPYEHNWLPSLNLKRIDSDSGRKYVTPEGNSYTSVTTFLSQLGEDYITEWKRAVGEDYANRLSLRASDRGTTLHESVEKYLKNEPITIQKTRFLDLSLMRSMLPLIKRISNIRILEGKLYSDVFKLAGTVDCVADFDGIKSTIDFKTTTKLKSKEDIESYFLQTSIYSYMLSERYGINYNRLVVLIAHEFGKGQVFIDDRRNYRNRLFELLKGK